MDINLLSFPSGAAKATGPTIVIDVFRAFTTASFALAGGAAEIVMVGELDEALALKASGRVDLSIGERGGVKPEGFDFGNSPSAMRDADLTGKRLVQTTSNGTASMVASTGATSRFAGALVNLSASVAAAVQAGADQLSIVAAGRKGHIKADEDEICGRLMGRVAIGEPVDMAAHRAALEAQFLTAEYLASRSEFGPAEDWALALEIDRFDFAIEVRQEEGLLVARAATGLA